MWISSPVGWWNCLNLLGLWWRQVLLHTTQRLLWCTQVFWHIFSPFPLATIPHSYSRRGGGALRKVLMGTDVEFSVHLRIQTRSCQPAPPFLDQLEVASFSLCPLSTNHWYLAFQCEARPFSQPSVWGGRRDKETDKKRALQATEYEKLEQRRWPFRRILTHVQTFHSLIKMFSSLIMSGWKVAKTDTKWIEWNTSRGSSTDGSFPCYNVFLWVLCISGLLDFGKWCEMNSKINVVINLWWLTCTCKLTRYASVTMWEKCMYEPDRVLPHETHWAQDHRIPRFWQEVTWQEEEESHLPFEKEFSSAHKGSPEFPHLQKFHTSNAIKLDIVLRTL